MTTLEMENASPFRQTDIAMTDDYPNRIRDLREQRGWSLQKLGDAADTSAQQVSRLEKGERQLDFDWISRISSALGVRPWELFPDGMLPADMRGLLVKVSVLNDEQRKVVEAVVDQLQKSAP